MTFPLTTTLRRIEAQGPCLDRWKRGLTALNKTGADDEPVAFAHLAELLPLADALWCCRAEPQHMTIWRRYAVWCARQVQHLMTDPRSLAALDVAERHAAGQASDEELAAVQAVAWAAAEDAARDAAWAATLDTDQEANWAATWAATWAAVGDAALAARDAARDAAQDAQRQAFIQVCTDGTLPS